MVNTYLVGQTIKITGTFKQNGVVGDPTVVRVIYKDPTGVSTTITFPNEKITKASTGVYSFEIPLILPGFWYYRMDDGGTNVASENCCQVTESNVL